MTFSVTDTPAEPQFCDSFTQTEEVINRDGITQTNIVEYNEEDCQTDTIDTYDAGVQSGKPLEVCEVGTDPDQALLDA